MLPNAWKLVVVNSLCDAEPNTDTQAGNFLSTLINVWDNFVGVSSQWTVKIDRNMIQLLQYIIRFPAEVSLTPHTCTYFQTNLTERQQSKGCCVSISSIFSEEITDWLINLSKYTFQLCLETQRHKDEASVLISIPGSHLKNLPKILHWKRTSNIWCSSWLQFVPDGDVFSF